MLFFVLLVLLLIWLLPNFLGLLLFIFTNKKNLILYKYNVIIFNNKIWFLPQRFNWVAGITFGNFIFLRCDDNFKIDDKFITRIDNRKYISSDIYRRLIYHEICHTQQQLIFGGLFFIIYLIDFIVNYVISNDWRYSYLNIYFERQARRFAIVNDMYYYRRKILDISKTIYNLDIRTKELNKLSEKIKLLEGLLDKERR